MELFSEDYLAHHGIKGQKWGVRRFQNADGTRTEAGKARYGSTRPSTSNDRSQALKSLADWGSHAQDSLDRVSSVRDKKLEALAKERPGDTYSEWYKPEGGFTDNARSYMSKASVIDEEWQQEERKVRDQLKKREKQGN